MLSRAALHRPPSLPPSLAFSAVAVGDKMRLPDDWDGSARYFRHRPPPYRQSSHLRLPPPCPDPVTAPACSTVGPAPSRRLQAPRRPCCLGTGEGPAVFSWKLNQFIAQTTCKPRGADWSRRPSREEQERERERVAAQEGNPVRRREKLGYPFVTSAAPLPQQSNQRAGAGAMKGWLNQMVQFLNSWAIRIAVLSSFAAHLVLILLAGIRRRKASGGRTLLLWLAYQLADWAAAYALSNLSFGSTSQEQQLVAFWAPFLLQHLGGPDNISAYSLEDNALSGRQAINVFVQVGGAIYVLYKHIYIGGGDGALLPASFIILTVGVAKYVEKVLALHRSDLGSIPGSSKKKKQPSSDVSGRPIRTGTDRQLDDEQALMVAHDMFPFCQRAMADSSVDMDSSDLNTSRLIFSADFGWENMCKVVEMELSLMYDILFTKAAMVHTWGGYFIRLVSPLATAVAFLLFWFYSKQGQRREDVIITYSLLAASFLLDIRWMLRALGSTWTHAFLQARPRCWLHRKVLCTGRWHRLRPVIVSLDPVRLVLVMSPSSYRMWSGTVGQYSLLHECTHDTESLCSKLAKKIGLENGWDEYSHSEGLKLSEDVKRLVFQRVGKILNSTYENKNKDDYSMNDIMTFWGQAAAKGREKKLKRFRLAFGREFQEDILVWHIATQMFLLCGSDQIQSLIHAKAIKALSEYLMFLVAVRRHMLPGLVLRSLYEVTLDALQAIWRDEAGTSHCSSTTRGEERLARILRDKKEADSEWGLEHDKTRLVSDGANIAMLLLSAHQSEMPQLLELVFNVWVDKLIYAGTRCSRESHAKQLSCGGELTTIVWIMAEHAGPFQIGQRGPDHKKSAAEKKDGSKKSDEQKPEALMPCSIYLPPPMYEPRPPPPGFSGQQPYTPASDQPCMMYYPPAFGGPADAKPKDGRQRTRRYATLYPVD